MKSDEHLILPGKHLALLFDGTGDKPEDNANCWRLAMMLADKGDDDVPQMKFGYGLSNARVSSSKPYSRILLVTGWPS